MTKLDECLQKNIDPTLLWLRTPFDGDFIAKKTFAQWRTNQGKSYQHQGTDVPMPLGTIIKASAIGRVWFRGKHPTYGNLVILKHSENGEAAIYTVYGHLSAFGAAYDECVAAGDPIGLSGSTGRSTGPHLHYEILKVKPGVKVERSGSNIGAPGIEKRIDPLHVFSTENKILTKASTDEVEVAVQPALASIKQGKMAITIAALVLAPVSFGLVVAAGFTAAAGLGLAVAVLGSGALLHGAQSRRIPQAYEAARQALEDAAARKLADLHQASGPVVDETMIVKQLKEAELSGVRSPNQRRKIEIDIREDIADNSDEISRLSGGISRIGGAISQLDRDLESVESSIESVSRQLNSVNSEISRKSLAESKAAIEKKESLEKDLAQAREKAAEINEKKAALTKELASANSALGAASSRGDETRRRYEEYTRNERGSLYDEGADDGHDSAPVDGDGGGGNADAHHDFSDEPLDATAQSVLDAQRAAGPPPANLDNRLP